LIALPVIAAFAVNITPMNLNLWHNWFMLMEQFRMFILSLCLTLVLLYFFSKIKSQAILKASMNIGCSSLIIYTLEPLFSMLATWLMFPQYLGGFDFTNVLLRLSPLDSLKRLPISIAAAFIFSPLILRAVDTVLIHLGRVLKYVKKGRRVNPLRS